MAKKHRSEKAAPLAEPARTSANDVQDAPHLIKVAYPPDPAVPYDGQSLGYLWFFLETREWLQKRTVGVGMIVDDVPIFTRPLVYAVPRDERDATDAKSETLVDGPTTTTFGPDDVHEVLKVHDGFTTLRLKDGREIVVMSDDLAMGVVEEYRRWQPTLLKLCRAMCAAEIMKPHEDLTGILIRTKLLKWLAVVHSLSETEALELPVRKILELLVTNDDDGNWSEPLFRKEAAKQLKVHPKTVTRWWKEGSGTFEVRRVGRGRYQYRARPE